MKKENKERNKISRSLDEIETVVEYKNPALVWLVAFTKSAGPGALPRNPCPEAGALLADPCYSKLRAEPPSKVGPARS